MKGWCRMKKKIHIICLLLIVTLLVGCQQTQPTPHEETLPDNLQIIQVDGPLAYGIDTEGKLDSEGLYYPYAGGEMTLDLYLQANGMQESGITVLLFLDGQPQPYQLEGSEKTAYMHTVYPQSQNDNLFGISFIPVTGSVGETLELCIMYLPAYHHSNSDGTYPWYDESNVTFYMTRIKLEKAPSETVLPEVKDRVLSLSSYNSEGKCYGRWIGIDAEWNLSFDVLDANGDVITGLGEGDRMRIYLELSGNPAEEYVLILYVDEEPVLIEGNALTFQVIEDQTRSVEIDLDCSGFDYMMFAILLEKNYSGDTVGWEAYPTEDNFRVFRMNSG